MWLVLFCDKSSHIIKVIASDSNRNQKKPAKKFAGYFKCIGISKNQS